MKQPKKKPRLSLVRDFNCRHHCLNSYQCHFVLDSDNLLEDLHIPDSRLLDGDAAELALIGKFHLFCTSHFYIEIFRTDPNTFEELHKAAECLLNLQGLFYFGEEEHGTERSNPFSAS